MGQSPIGLTQRKLHRASASRSNAWILFDTHPTQACSLRKHVSVESVLITYIDVGVFQVQELLLNEPKAGKTTTLGLRGVGQSRVTAIQSIVASFGPLFRQSTRYSRSARHSRFLQAVSKPTPLRAVSCRVLKKKSPT